MLCGAICSPESTKLPASVHHIVQRLPWRDGTLSRRDSTIIVIGAVEKHSMRVYRRAKIRITEAVICVNDNLVTLSSHYRWGTGV